MTGLRDVLSKFLSTIRLLQRKYCESLQHHSLDSEGSPYARTGTAKIYSKMGSHFAIGRSEKGVSHSIKIASGLAATTSNGWFH
jgi:hypothetical protein